jgi:hypothetical protein
MKILKDTPPTTKLKRRVLVELDPGEKLIAVHDNRFYQLGHPICDVLAGHIVSASEQVQWCSVSQEWKA